MEIEIVNEIMTAISTVGFPIVVAMYSLIRLEKTVKENTNVIQKVLDKLDGQDT